MKLYISADIEGISGVTNNEHQSTKGRVYAEAQRWMTGDVNAAIEGACEVGIEEVLVKDAHGSALNILPDELDERAALIQGWNVGDGMMAGLRQDHDLAFRVGYHPMAGTPDGVLAHTWTSALKGLVINDTEMGEMGLSALFAGALDVPIGLVTSCETGRRQALELLPWVEAVAVKKGLTQSAAEVLPIKRAQKLIREAAKRAVKRLDEMQPLRLEGPVTAEVTWSTPRRAETCALVPGVEQTGTHTVRLVADDQLSALRLLRVLLALS
jgi:D-amino peptidase